MVNPNLLGQIAAGGPNPMAMLRKAKHDDAMIRGAGLDNQLRELQVEDARYKSTPEYRKAQSELAGLEYKSKYAEAMSKMKDAELKEVQRKTDRLGQVASWVLTLPNEMRAQAWDNALDGLKGEGIDATTYKGKYSDDLAGMMYRGALTVKEQFELQGKGADRKLREREVAATERNANTTASKAELERRQYEENQKLIKSLLPAAGAPMAPGQPPADSGQAPAVPGQAPAGGMMPMAGATPESMDVASVAAAAGGNSALAASIRDVRDRRYPAPTNAKKKIDEGVSMGIPEDIMRMVEMGMLSRSTDMMGNTVWLDLREGDWVAKVERGQVVRNPKYYGEPGAGDKAAPGNVVIDYTKGR